jgi:putative ABC transport system permease protein
MMTLFNLFSVLSIIISCIGLFGLSALAIEAKRKEIGIRKVLGANIRQLFSLLSREFVIIVLSGALIAVPLCWYAINKWLQNFAYSIDVDAWIFILAGIIALAVSMITVSLNVIKAAVANPVDSLRNE